MKKSLFKKYYIFSVIGVLSASFYPLYMGARVVIDMITQQVVHKENYPKYIIPYTPISIAIIAGVLLIPLFIKLFKKYALIGSSVVSAALFFVFETAFENMVISTVETVKLADWQMYMCCVQEPYVIETVYSKQALSQILLGEYNPAFKIHFYMISVVLILSVLNCLYGFAQMIKTNDKKRFKALVLQSVSAASFLGMCILACFTAFWRDGDFLISPLSAFLMSAFFILLGVTVGIFTGSFLLSKSRLVSVLIPSAVSGLFTFLMYAGEMILLGGNLYRFGSGAFFNSIAYGISFSAADISVIILSGCVTALILGVLNRHTIKGNRKSDTNEPAI